jgi:hypothetical protein
LTYALYKSITFAHPNHHFQNELRNAFLNFKSVIFKVPEFWFGLWRFWVWFDFVLGLLWVGLGLVWVCFGIGLGQLSSASSAYVGQGRPSQSASRPTSQPNTQPASQPASQPTSQQNFCNQNRATKTPLKHF